MAIHRVRHPHSSVALAVVALAALSVAACSGGGGGNKSLPPPTAQPTTTPAKAAGAPNVPTQQQSQLDIDSGDSSNQKITDPPPTSSPAPAPAPKPHKTASAEQPAPVTTINPGEVIMDPRGMTPAQIFAGSDAQGPAHLGAHAKVAGGEPLFYTGAAQDFLHDQLADVVAAVKDQNQAELNAQFAREIGMSTFEVNWGDRAAKLSVTLRQNGRDENLNFTGTLSSDMKIRGSSKSSGLAYEATCMDGDGGCQTTYVHLKRKIGKAIAEAHVIVRLTNAYLYIEGNPPGAAKNPEYDNLMNLLLNTVTQPGSPDSVQALGFYTSETIGGSSDFAVLMRLGIQDPNRAAGDAQVMGLIGALVKHAKTSDENVAIKNPPSEATVIGRRTFLLPTVIANTIREVRLVKNDGRGNLQFTITVRKSSATAQEDTIRLTIARLQQDTRTL